MNRTFEDNLLLLLWFGYPLTEQNSARPESSSSKVNPTKKSNTTRMGGTKMEDSKKINMSLDVVAQTDQMCSHMESFANVLNAYRSQLRKGGMSKEETFHIIMDFQSAFWQKQFYPDGQIGYSIEDL